MKIGDDEATGDGDNIERMGVLFAVVWQMQINEDQTRQSIRFFTRVGDLSGRSRSSRTPDH
jgi:hypothetical protein